MACAGKLMLMGMRKGKGIKCWCAYCKTLTLSISSTEAQQSASKNVCIY